MQAYRTSFPSRIPFFRPSQIQQPASSDSASSTFPFVHLPLPSILVRTPLRPLSIDSSPETGRLTLDRFHRLVVMAQPSSNPNLPGGGPAPLLTLRTMAPLPIFRTPHGIPPPSTSISSFKLSILRILTGQTNSTSSTKPLTFSEELKEKTIQSWRMEMLMLELRQADDLDQQTPPTATPQPSDAKDEEISGFELQDDHECALLEEGDEILIRLKPGHRLEDLQLPDLGPNHRYSAPAGSLTRAGTLSEPPPYSIANPTEPSSHSSSVAAQPNTNFQAHNYYDYSRGYRVVTANNVAAGVSRRNNANANGGILGQGLNLVPSSRQRPSGARKVSSRKEKVNASGRVVSASASPAAAPPTPNSSGPNTPTISSPKLGTFSTPDGVGQSQPMRQTASQPATTPTIQQQQQARQTASPSVTYGTKQAAGQMSMPATALIIGPGVQGAVGRSISSAAAPMGSYGGPTINSDEYGNAKDFVGFTAASGEVQARPKRKMSRQMGDELAHSSTDSGQARGAEKMRRPSNPQAAAADAAERRAALARKASEDPSSSTRVKDRDTTLPGEPSTRPYRERQASSPKRLNKIELPDTSFLPPIQNISPFPEFDDQQQDAVEAPSRERGLPPMPSAVGAPRVVNGQVVPAHATLPGPSPVPRRQSSTSTRSTSIQEVQNGIEALRMSNNPQSSEQSTPVASPSPELPLPASSGAAAAPKMTKAERRYAEIQKALAKERERQEEAEKLRIEEAKAYEEKKRKELLRRESEDRSRAEERKWAIWDEVRKRQKNGGPLKMPVPPVIKGRDAVGTEGASGASNGPVGERLDGSGAWANGEGSDDGVFVQGDEGKEADRSPTPPLKEAMANRAYKVEQASSPLVQARPSTVPPAENGSGADSKPSESKAEGRGKIDLGLQRIRKLLRRLGSPQLGFPIIHVAGTNGKGSVVVYLATLLRLAVGVRVGQFNSPHLVERRDSCRVDGEIVDERTWRESQARVLAADQGLETFVTGSPGRSGRLAKQEEEEEEEGEQVGHDDGGPLGCTPFELLTAQSLVSFSLLPEATRPEVLLIEVGLGGRLDATNVFSQRQVLASVICPIAKDHEAFLGNKLEGIAREKAGIIKRRGLCIVADQRGLDGSDQAEEDRSLTRSGKIDMTAMGPLENEVEQLGQRAASIVDSIRNVCMEKGARMVKGFIPWEVLEKQGGGFGSESEREVDGDGSSNLNAKESLGQSWGSTVDLRPQLGPTLKLSVSGYNPPSTFVASPGDPPLQGPLIQLQRTRANLTGACTALQTLWSIARDESAAMTATADEFEELRTKIMWSFRDDDEAKAVMSSSLSNVTWEGRCQWLDVQLPERGPYGREVVSHLLVDGAHNPASSLALREYVDSCIVSKIRKLGGGGGGNRKGKDKGKGKRVGGDQGERKVKVRITWLIGFSEGKDVQGMLGPLLLRRRGETIDVEQRVAILKFQTPVEGMPWVKSLDPEKAKVEVEKILATSSSFAQVRTFDEQDREPALIRALRWSLEEEQEQETLEMRVLCGSLYLVGDLYSIVRDQHGKGGGGGRW
ncbi:hypothetical protein IE53DRAFT_239262 [Violaceomyces palustris]|uniref:Uncharacterized protein n=1 Tax=Violaceomyces palustris TaxID=1673888 RepID=A0ACD0P8E4_9BASI|nr:hypothetical protein IE53DRAFT_239262 [Violaceomyces palustris]